MSWILVIMTVVGHQSGNVYQDHIPVTDWRPIGEFRTYQSCMNAGTQLKPATSIKCLEK